MSDADKKARLAEALRANLRKRKAQARKIAAEAPETLRGDPPASESQ